jgi:hypothetical protein
LRTQDNYAQRAKPRCIASRRNLVWFELVVWAGTANLSVGSVILEHESDFARHSQTRIWRSGHSVWILWFRSGRLVEPFDDSVMVAVTTPTNKLFGRLDSPCVTRTMGTVECQKMIEGVRNA